MILTSSQYQAYFKSLLLSVLVLTSSFVHGGDAVVESRTDAYATAFWNSFNTDLSTGALEVYLSHWDENAERITPTIHAKGIKEIRATYQSYLNAYSDFHQTELRRMIDGNVVISELLTRATDKLSGDILSLPNVAIVEFNGVGKVIRARVYMDTRKFNP